MEPMGERYGRNAYGTRLGDYRVLLVQDDDGENPREWENFGTLWFRPQQERGYGYDRYRHYGDQNLSDIDSAWEYFTDESPAMSAFGSVRLAHIAFARWLRMVKGATHIKSVSVIEHSGITIRYQKEQYIERPVDWGHGTFDALIFDTTEGRALCNPHTDADIRKWLTAELAMTKAWMEGNVYVITTQKHDAAECDDGQDCDDNECSAWEDIESVGGYYGDDDAEAEAYQELAALYLTTRPEEAHA